LTGIVRSFRVIFRRSRAREVALQLLFQQDVNKIQVKRGVIERFAENRLREPDLVSFCLELFDGVCQHQKDIDTLLSATAEKWKLHRMMPVDRNVLRLGVYELLHQKVKQPKAVTINEAIELARRYATADSSSFVNGILDKISQRVNDSSPVSGTN
jgi:transcription antitermination protein NusB